MFAVIKTGGKQYRVEKDDVFVVEKLVAEAGDTIQFDQVLMIGEDGKAPTVGSPMLDKAVVSAEVVRQTRGEKIIIFKKRRRQNSRRRNGHRQDLTLVKIVDISATGTKKAAAKKAPAKKAVASDDTKAVAETAPAKTAPAQKAPAKKAPAKKAAAKKADKE